MDYEISTDKSRLDVAAIHRFLSEDSYWAKDIPLKTVEKAIAGSLCFGVYHGKSLVGFARVTTDTATFAYLADVFVLPEHRGHGLSKRLMQFILDHPDLQGLRRFLLATRDAHGLYEGFGFKPLDAPGNFLQINRPDVYRR